MKSLVIRIGFRSCGIWNLCISHNQHLRHRQNHNFQNFVESEPISTVYLGFTTQHHCQHYPISYIRQRLAWWTTLKWQLCLAMCKTDVYILQIVHEILCLSSNETPSSTSRSLEIAKTLKMSHAVCIMSFFFEHKPILQFLWYPLGTKKEESGGDRRTCSLKFRSVRVFPCM